MCYNASQLNNINPITHMRKYLFSTSSLNFVNISILSAALCASNVAKAGEFEYGYNPNIEISARGGKKRSISELDYLQPIWEAGNNLSLVDLKLKMDNHKSKEINLGLVNRYNFDDNFVLGVYGYFDHRQTGNGFKVNGITIGAEVLSKYIDARVNYYKPLNDKKKIQHNNKKKVVIEGTSIFALSGAHNYEYALTGYDIEIGTPVFSMFDNLNDSIGTKVFVAKYDFRHKNAKSISGIRFRLEQPLGSLDFGDNALHFNLNAESQYDKVRKRQNYIGLGAKFDIGNKKKKSKGLSARMMDTVIRDVDIVTDVNRAAEEKSHFTMNGREVKKIYYVGAANSNYKGDGTKDSPLSIDQLGAINLSDAMVVVTTIDQNKGGKAITKNEYTLLHVLPQTITGKEVSLVSAGADKVVIDITADRGTNLVVRDKLNTEVIIDNIIAPVQTFSNQGSARAESMVSLDRPTITEETSTPTSQNQIAQQQESLYEIIRQVISEEEVLRQQEAATQERIRAEQREIARLEQEASMQREMLRHQEQEASMHRETLRQQEQENARRMEEEREEIVEDVVEVRAVPERREEVRNVAPPPRREEIRIVEEEFLGDLEEDDFEERIRLQEELTEALSLRIRFDENNPQLINLREELNQQVRIAQNITGGVLTLDAINQLEQRLNRVERVVIPIPQNVGNLGGEVRPQEINAQVLNQPPQVIIENELTRTTDSGVNINELTPLERELYQLITQVEQLIALEGSRYAEKEKAYNAVKEIFAQNQNAGDNIRSLVFREGDINNVYDENNTQYSILNIPQDAVIIYGHYSNETKASKKLIQGIKNIIENNINLTWQQKFQYKNLADKVPEFNGIEERAIQRNNNHDGQQGVGVGGKGVRDLTTITSLERLKNIYGVIDGQRAIELMEEISVNFIKLKVPTALNQGDIGFFATNAQTQNSQRYQDALNNYDNYNIAPQNETNENRLQRENLRNQAMQVLEEEINSGDKRINKYLAAYRGLNQIQVVEDFYTDKITGRFESREYLGYTLRAILDVQEIQQNLIAGGKEVTTKNIYERQKENLDQLLTNLGDGKRGYNKRDDGLDNGQGDSTACPHGVCVRIFDATMDKHRDVRIVEASPGDLANEFIENVTVKLRNLPDNQKLEVKNFLNNLNNGDIFYEGRAVVENNKVKFYIDDDEGGVNVAPVNQLFQGVVSEVVDDLALRYTFLHLNPKDAIGKYQSSS
jgi:hypothetical protein